MKTQTQLKLFLDAEKQLKSSEKKPEAIRITPRCSNQFPFPYVFRLSFLLMFLFCLLAGWLAYEGLDG